MSADGILQNAVPRVRRCFRRRLCGSVGAQPERLFRGCAGSLARGTEQSQGLRISWATPRTCSTHPGKEGWRGEVHLSGVTQKLHRATHPADEMTSKAEALGDGAISWRTLQPSTEGRHSLKGSPWVMKAAPAGREAQRAGEALSGPSASADAPSARAPNQETHSASLLAPLSPNLSIIPSASARPEASASQEASTPRIRVLACKGVSLCIRGGAVWQG